jgi:ankyrin repeat protein
VAILLNHKAPVNAIILMAAVSENYSEMMQLLIEAQELPLPVNEWWPEESYLTADPSMAPYGGPETAVRLLLESGTDARAKVSGCTALHLAVMEGRGVVVRLLLAHGADINAKSDSRKPALYRPPVEGHKVVVQQLENEADFEVMFEDGQTALHLTAESGSKEVVRLLLEHKEVVQLLLEHKAEVDAKDNDGWTALYAVAWNVHVAVVRLLLGDYKADVKTRRRYTWRPGRGTRKWRGYC